MDTELEAYRKDLIRDVLEESDQSQIHPVRAFVARVVRKFGNELGIPQKYVDCYLDRPRQGRFRRMRIDAGAYDETLLEGTLVLADFDEQEKRSLGKEDILDDVKCLVNFFENACQGFFPPEACSPEADLASALVRNRDALNRIHLFIFTTNQLSSRLKEFKLPTLIIAGKPIAAKLDIVDIERMFNAVNGKEELVINVEDFKFQPIPCVKAALQTDAYTTYLAIVPGLFLAEIYKEYGGRLMKANVRSFLNMTGPVNRGIRDTIRTEPERFFAYNNGIATTARAVDFVSTKDGLAIRSFTDLQIINGGQTTASLALVNVKDGNSLDGIFVQMKLTIAPQADKQFIRNIAKFANSQTKVTTTDLNSSHEYYVALETMSRRIYAPVAPGEIRPTKWFFERTKKQYEQPMFQMSKTEQKRYQALYPKRQKFTVQDLARNIQLAELRPFDVAWGGEVNARRFHEWLESKWDENPSFCDEKHWRNIVALAILYVKIKTIVLQSTWYKEKKGNLAQIVAYTFSKLFDAVRKEGFEIDLLKIWQEQSVSSDFDDDVRNIAKTVFDYLYDPKRGHAHYVREWCKRKECWQEISDIPIQLSDTILNGLKA
jgi:hypothetical protein